MNIYLVERTDSVNYDEYDSFVCYAESEQKAREIHPDGTVDFDEHDWIRSSETYTLKVTKIGSNDKITKSLVILSSFKAG